MVQEIYIIDDDDSSIVIFRELFKNDTEYKFISVKTEQIDVALKNIPSLIVINEDAIDRDVVDLCRKIRKDEDNTITPVIVVSSKNTKDHRIRILQESIEYFIKKPVDEEYLYYKSRLLTVCKTGVINRKTEHYDEIVRDSTCRLVTYELADSGAGTGSEPCALADGGAGTGLEPCAPADGSPADFTGGNLHYASDHEFVGIEFDIRGGLNGRVRVGMPGKFNADNALAALAVCRLALSKEREASGDPAAFDQAMMNALADVRVDGRMELVHVSSKCSVIVDYAHNAVSMESLLKTLRAYHPKRLVCVFGCGGNRAKERRYSMGEIGGRLADFCILTADNPRFEKNEDIIKDIEIGMAKTSGKYMVIPDRKEAILYAVRHAETGDMIAVIGKGHEDYQEIEGVRHHFLDREIVEEAVRETE